MIDSGAGLFGQFRSQSLSACEKLFSGTRHLLTVLAPGPAAAGRSALRHFGRLKWCVVIMWIFVLLRAMLASVDVEGLILEILVASVGTMTARFEFMESIAAKRAPSSADGANADADAPGSLGNVSARSNSVTESGIADPLVDSQETPTASRTSVASSLLSGLRFGDGRWLLPFVLLSGLSSLVGIFRIVFLRTTACEDIGLCLYPIIVLLSAILYLVTTGICYLVIRAIVKKQRTATYARTRMAAARVDHADRSAGSVVGGTAGMRTDGRSTQGRGQGRGHGGAGSSGSRLLTAQDSLGSSESDTRQVGVAGNVSGGGHTDPSASLHTYANSSLFGSVRGSAGASNVHAAPTATTPTAGAAGTGSLNNNAGDGSKGVGRGTHASGNASATTASVPVRSSPPGGSGFHRLSHEPQAIAGGGNIDAGTSLSPPVATVAAATMVTTQEALAPTPAPGTTRPCDESNTAVAESAQPVPAVAATKSAPAVQADQQNACTSPAETEAEAAMVEPLAVAQPETIAEAENATEHSAPVTTAAAAAADVSSAPEAAEASVLTQAESLEVSSAFDVSATTMSNNADGGGGSGSTLMSHADGSRSKDEPHHDPGPGTGESTDVPVEEVTAAAAEASSSSSCGMEIMLRLPGGERQKHTINSDGTVKDLYSLLLLNTGLDYKDYRLVMSHPRRALEDLAKTLSDAGLASQVVLHVEPIKKEPEGASQE
eukprot:TRINITY_DN54524_c0_g1_i1.p1 TRINITY_DN54524_c0_g1~~TRINITY_DN54524_c0_g1_i1.p1  ORF type:complete len:779 (+),score=145.15 TRINITY_DN54524_c0_g1_i1:189-2339(+)